MSDGDDFYNIENMTKMFAEGLIGQKREAERFRGVAEAENAKLRQAISEMAWQQSEEEAQWLRGANPAGRGGEYIQIEIPIREHYLNNRDLLRDRLEYGYRELLRGLLERMETGKHYTIQLYEEGPDQYLMASVRQNVALADVDVHARQESVYAMYHGSDLNYRAVLQIVPAIYEQEVIPVMNECSVYALPSTYYEPTRSDVEAWSGDLTIEWLAKRLARNSAKVVRRRIGNIKASMAEQWAAHIEKIEREKEEFQG